MKEAKTVLHTKAVIDGVEQEVLVMPITRLDCIEDTAAVAETASDEDYIPVIDSADGGQMKKIKAKTLFGADSPVGTAVSDAKAEAAAAKAAAETAQTAAANAAAAASEAQSAAQSASSASTPTLFSVEAAAWTALASPVAGCGYSANVSAEGVTAGDFPDVYFDAASIEAASTAGVLADTAEGAVVLYAKSIPTTALSGAYFIRKGVTE